MITHSLVLAMAAQLGTVTIEGQVRDARTRGEIPFARIELLRGQTPIGRLYTDSLGRFRFGLQTAGSYVVVVEYSGYEPSLVELDTFSGASPVTVELVRQRTPSTVHQPVVSVRQYLVPKQARKEFERARKEARRQNCAAAVIHFENGLRTYDEDASAHNDLGNCYRSLGQLDRAERSFHRARALSDSVYVSLNLAEVYGVQNRFEEAESVLLETIAGHPGAGDAYYGLSLVYAAQGALERAETQARRAEALPHRIADVHLLLARIYSRQGKEADMGAQLEMYLKEAPEGPSSKEVRQVIKKLGKTP